MKNIRFKRRGFRLLAIALIVFLSNLTIVAQVVIQRCDVTTGWTGDAAFSIDNSDKKEGKGSLSTEAQSGDFTWFSKSFAMTHTGIDISGYLSFWLYVSDASKLEGGQIYISSSGGPDAEASSWALDKTHVVDGWNLLQLQISLADQTGGGANLDSINFIQISQNLSGPITAKVDFIRFAPGVGEPTWPELDVAEVDNASLDGKVMFGYQGWFNHPDDGADLGWVHWTNFYEPISSTVDMYPDMREYGMDEKYDADLTFQDGRMAPVFSSFNKKTVVRHMKWIRDYNLDGVFVQRFISSANSLPKMNNKDTVTRHVMEGCETYGRVFAVMYDGIGDRVADIKADWMHLVDDIDVTGTDRYLNHRGLPLVALWGYTVRDEATVDQLVELIDWFKNNPEPRYRASLLLGVAWNWYDQSASWMNAFQDVEVISPWFSGSTDYDRGQAWCDENNVDFLPVVHPGFSWHNLYDAPKNATPREGGNYFWDEVTEVVSKNAKSVYIAMFDEVDEGTAMFKLAENDEMTPTEGYWRIMAIRIIDEVNDNDQGGMEFIFPDFPDESTIEISIDSGATYAFSTPDDAGSFTILDLSEGNYHVLVRHEAGAAEVDMGGVFIGNSIEIAPSVASEPYPADLSTDVRTELTLGWKEGEQVQSHVIYFGKTNPPDSVSKQASATYQPEKLEENTTYYWQVDEVNAFGRAEGPLWSFTTGSESSSNYVVLDYCDSETAWRSSNGINIDTEDKKEGYASLISQGGGTDWFTKTFDIPVNSLCDESSYLDLWLYVSDVSKFNGGGQLEITSAGKPDENEYNWGVGDLNLSNGWNELHLQISSANVMGNPDLSKINFFRLYQFVSGEVISRVDIIKFSGIVFEVLAPPTNLTALAGDGSVSLDWDDNTEASLAGYNIYRALTPGLFYTMVNTEPVPSSDYTDTDINNGTKYYYKVKATDNAGTETESSNVVVATPASDNTSVSTMEDVGAKIYPNPVNDLLHIEVKNGVSASIYDFTGRKVKFISLSNEETSIQLGDMSSGEYVIQVITIDGSGVYKLIKE